MNYNKALRVSPPANPRIAKVFNLKAFTLAEVLITLGVIGIVAAMTIPTLVANYQKKQLLTQNKHAYALIINALNNVKIDSPNLTYNTLFDTSKDASEVMTEFSKYFKGAKIRPANKSYKIKYMSPIESENEDNKNSSSSIGNNHFQLNNGIIIGIKMYDSCVRSEEYPRYNADGSLATDADGNVIYYTATDESCADIKVDVNGEKAPNQYGKDVFGVRVKPDKYSFPCTRFFGCVENIIKYNDFYPNIIDYEINGDFRQ